MSTTTGTTVVLGWDGLDYELLKEFSLRDEFGAHYDCIETFENDIIGEPHTREIWPSIITGVGPDDHGIYAKESDDGVQWENRYLDLLSSAAQGVIPHSARLALGKLLRERGHSVKQYTPEYYAENNITTLFDGRRARSLSVPNYLTKFDRKVGLTSDRDDIWEQAIGSKDGQTGYSPSVSTQELDHILSLEASKRMGHLSAAFQREYDLVFCWFGYLDTVGHIAPCVDEDGWQRRHYEQAARWTRQVRDELGEEDTLVCVSDHGLQRGKHTHQATIASDDKTIIRATESVFDVRDVLDSVTSSRDGVGAPAVRDRYTHDGGGDDWSVEEVEEQLSDLGYIDA